MKIVSKGVNSKKRNTYHIYVETTIERRITVVALSEEEAKDLAYRRAVERTKAFNNRHYKVLEHEVVHSEVKQ